MTVRKITFVLFFFFALSFSSSTKREAPKDPFTLVFRTLSNKRVSLKPYRGEKVILLDFWATWCQPCLREMPHFEKLYKKYRKRGFLVIGVNYEEEKKDILHFVRKLKVDYPIWKGTTAHTDALGIVGLPTTYLLDRRGQVVKRWSGFAEPKEVEKEVRKFLFRKKR